MMAIDDNDDTIKSVFNNKIHITLFIFIFQICFRPKCHIFMLIICFESYLGIAMILLLRHYEFSKIIMVILEYESHYIWLTCVYALVNEDNFMVQGLQYDQNIVYACGYGTTNGINHIKQWYTQVSYDVHHGIS